MTGTGTDIRTHVAAQRHELADLLADLPESTWDTPSLCAGWRVREVVAHLVLPFRYSMPRFLASLLRARGNFDRMADRCARRDAAALSTHELVAVLRDNAEHPWQPPGGGPAGALSHDVIHGLDITTALGHGPALPPERVRLVLDNAGPRQVRHFGTDLSGVELRADDLDWRYGSGAPLTGAAQDLLLVLCGRRLPPGRLAGEPAPRFTAT
ncbi:maleylpyruvate isomerase family mycothiol-dependent enzyme [Prauserella muralis]|uniref:Mycothiol-dependent maleylpyruvate isomerase metal-binding domain-containing protein n=1 Tax=Prauserella muralis TaxID=588067 RepID=A0A2V4B1P8_9PSEU|nr:maleylpyruvate isomerase family mycothiol-dependent enzyme [Prauserella muralis]PXY22485.1 hypothetical protein BAY60_21805 [Prauserella muralis]TWE28163.1 uncharacterized protein (TIGR03083 family) [Prauserella muralis]